MANVPATVKATPVNINSSADHPLSVIKSCALCDGSFRVANLVVAGPASRTELDYLKDFLCSHDLFSVSVVLWCYRGTV